MGEQKEDCPVCRQPPVHKPEPGEIRSEFFDYCNACGASVSFKFQNEEYRARWLKWRRNQEV